MWHHAVASGSGICTWSLFPCLHPLRGYSPRGDALPVKGGRVPHSHPKMGADRLCCPSSLRDSFPPEQAWTLTLCFCKTPYPWVSFCSAGKPLESRNPRMAGGNSWKMCQHCAAEQGGPSYLWTAGVQQEAFCHRMELSAGCKAFLGSSTNTQSIWVSLQSLHCQLCLQAGKKSGRWGSWSCLKMYNTQESGGGRKEPASVKSEHVNSVASILSHLLCSPALQSVSHTEVYF